MTGEPLETWVKIVVGAVVGVVLGYAVWVVVLVPMSQGFSETAYGLRNALALFGMNRLGVPWALLVACGAGGAVVGWGLSKR